MKWYYSGKVEKLNYVALKKMILVSLKNRNGKYSVLILMRITTTIKK